MIPRFKFNPKFLSLFFFLLPYLVIQAQDNTIDSLLNLLKKEKTDTGKINHYNNLFLQYEFTDNVKAKEYVNKALELSKKIDYKKGLAITYKYLGFFAEDTGNYQQAIIHYQQSLKISEKLVDKKGISATLGNIGSGYYYQGDYPKALNFYFKALRITEELGDKNGTARHLGNIGNVYKEQSNFPKALEYYFKGLQIAKELGNKKGIAANFGNIGIVFKEQARIEKSKKNITGSDTLYKKSLDYSFKALNLNKELEDNNSIATQLSNIGTVYHDQKEYQKALDYSFKALKMDEELGDKYGIAIDLGNIGSLYTEIKKYTEAEKYLLQALNIADSIGILKEKIQFENSISELYTQTGKDKKAFEHYKIAIQIRDTLINEDKYREIMNYEFEKKEAAGKAEQDKKDALAAVEKRKQKIIIWSVVGGLLLVILFAAFILRSLRITRKQKHIIELQKVKVDEANNELHQQNEEILAQRNEIEAQRDEITAQRDLVTIQKEQIEKIHLEVSQSINYATRIQTAILPEPELMNKYISEHFVLFRPKDKVSGDFYWWAIVENHLIVTVADCTGHGVPGAFMSMLGTSFLREIVVKEYITNPAIILKRLRKEIIQALKQKGDYGEQKDGMDMALIVINTETLEMQYAGANNPLYIIRTSNPDIEEIRPDKMPVAIYEYMHAYTNHETKIHQGDCIYIMSDGYQDQFGGPKKKKFLSKKLKELLKENSHLAMNVQKELLEKTHLDWKGNGEQIDDITVIGIRI